MISVQGEIQALEDQLRQAELGPDPAFFQKYVDDNMVFVADGQSSKPKAKIVEAHTPGKGQKFTRVEMSDTTIIDHGDCAVVTTTGIFEGPSGVRTLKFMRVWMKKGDGWKIVAGAMI